jgi:alpha-galactosidase
MIPAMHEKVVLVGAGSAMFTRGLVADILRQGWTGEIGLVDTDPHALKVAERLCRKMIDARGGPLQLQASTNRRDVLADATAVICTIGVGGRRAWEQDVFIPRRHRIYQPVGDTVMPGGTSRALRMIPPMVDIARDVLDLAPRALFFNYGNPMSPVCRAVRKATGANVVGLCHGVFDVAAHLAALLGAERARMRYAAVGINHLTWFTHVRVDGRDAIPRLRELAGDRLREWRASGAPRTEIEDVFTWQLTELFGAFPAVLDRHVVEFFPHMFGREGAYFGRTLGVDAYRFENVIEHGDRIFEEMRAQAFADGPLPPDYFDKLGGEHEQVTEIIESVRGDAGEVFSANLPNRGQVANLPAEAVIECPAIADADGMHAIRQDPLPAGVAGTLATRFGWVETVVEAALEGSRAKFVQALLLDGSVTGLEQARRLADELLGAQAAHLPRFA